MLGWGITFMGVGGLSFLLPLFGKQFILVSLLGFTGMGSAIAGIVLFIIGVLLFNAANKKEAADLKAHIEQTVQQAVSQRSAPPQALANSINTSDIDNALIAKTEQMLAPIGAESNARKLFDEVKMDAQKHYGDDIYSVTFGDRAIQN